ncbi:DsbA family oxidoreductase [Siminovitchia fortis]|uniref:DsbA family oxidoreductase n=1 Tax=Siminovitchia fortis TaxID=254758 RepID=UPI0011A08690|nr:DsbA family oxidoreductase [Siminovitchia fortis]
MKIEVWSDYACPFCYIGKRRLEKALETFDHRDQVDVQFKSFELEPEAPRVSDESMYEKLAGKYGISVDEAKRMNEGIRRQAAEEGLTFNFDTMIPTNTFDAHRLAHFAESKNKEKEVHEKLLHAYFTESKHLGDHEVLADIAAEAGIDRDETLAFLADETALVDEVRNDEQASQLIGVRGVPFFLINRKYGISGAQPIDTFLAALEKVWQEESSEPILQNLGSGDAGACVDGSCDLPDEK